MFCDPQDKIKLDDKYLPLELTFQNYDDFIMAKCIYARKWFLYCYTIAAANHC